MGPMKDAGLRDVRAARRRVGRLRAMGRVLPADEVYITKRLDEVEARIVAMYEEDEEGKEVG